MSYIKFIGEDVKYIASVMPFKTQHGISAVNISSVESIPVTEKGFKFYDDDDRLIEDYSDYKTHYNGNSYSLENDTIEYGEGSNAPLGPSVLSIIESNVAGLRMQTIQNSSDIQELTPYMETKKAYIDDTEIIFENMPEGKVLINAINSDGNSVDALYNREGDRVIVSFFEPLEYVTDVTIIIQ